MARTIACYGSSGIGKTNFCYSFVEWYLENYGVKKIRWITTDGGGYQPIKDSGLVEAKIVEAVNLTNKQEFILSATRLISEGFWFRRLTDGTVNLRNTDEYKTKLDEWNNIGVIVVDGITGLAQLISQKMMTSQDKVAFKRPFEYEEEGLVFGGTDRGHVGLIQNVIVNFLMKMSSLPCDFVLFTGLPGTGDDYKAVKQYGIQVAGSAVNASILKEINEIWHIEKKELNINGVDKTVRIAWFDDHKDEDTGYTYNSKTRVAASYRYIIDEKYPNKFVPLSANKGIKPYYDLLKQIEEKQKADMAEKLKRWKEPKEGK